MSVQDAAEILDRFVRRAKRLDSVIAESLRVRAQNTIKLQTIDAIYESVFMSYYSNFETFVEELFYSCVLGESRLPGVTGIVVPRTRSDAETLVVGASRYAKWLPFDQNVEKTARRWLVDGKPFDRLVGHELELATLNDARVIRNAIAHDSDSARSAALRLTSPMRARRRHAAGYLQNVKQGRTEFTRHVLMFHQIASALANSDEALAHRSLSPQTPIKSGKSVPPASWDCIRCSLGHITRARTPVLPVCTRCGGKKSEWRRRW